MTLEERINQKSESSRRAAIARLNKAIEQVEIAAEDMFENELDWSEEFSAKVLDELINLKSMLEDGLPLR